AERYGEFPLRVYAPVGSHEDLLPYLVRRLLENGANTSFVYALLDAKTPIEKVVVDPITAVEAAGAGPHPRIPLPRDLYGPSRRNSQGVDLSIAADRSRLAVALDALDQEALTAGPIVNGQPAHEGPGAPAVSPSDLNRTIAQ